MSWVWFMDALGAGIKDFALVADAGSYSISGNGVGATLFADPGSYAISGMDATLEHHRFVDADTGEYALTGVAIGEFAKTIRFFAFRGEYVINGERIILIHTKIPIQDPEPYVENRWVQPQDEGNLGADVTVEQG